MSDDDAGGCRRGCPYGECYCAEPLIADFLFPDGDGPDDWDGEE